MFIRWWIIQSTYPLPTIFTAKSTDRLLRCVHHPRAPSGCRSCTDGHPSIGNEQALRTAGITDEWHQRASSGCPALRQIKLQSTSTKKERRPKGYCALRRRQTKKSLLRQGEKLHRLLLPISLVIAIQTVQCSSSLSYVVLATTFCISSAFWSS